MAEAPEWFLGGGPSLEIPLVLNARLQADGAVADRLKILDIPWFMGVPRGWGRRPALEVLLSVGASVDLSAASAPAKLGLR